MSKNRWGMLETMWLMDRIDRDKRRKDREKQLNAAAAAAHPELQRAPATASSPGCTEAIKGGMVIFGIAFVVYYVGAFVVGAIVVTSLIIVLALIRVITKKIKGPKRAVRRGKRRK